MICQEFDTLCTKFKKEVNESADKCSRFHFLLFFCVIVCVHVVCKRECERERMGGERRENINEG